MKKLKHKNIVNQISDYQIEENILYNHSNMVLEDYLSYNHPLTKALFL